MIKYIVDKETKISLDTKSVFIVFDMIWEKNTHKTNLMFNVQGNRYKNTNYLQGVSDELQSDSDIRNCRLKERDFAKRVIWDYCDKNNISYEDKRYFEINI